MTGSGDLRNWSACRLNSSSRGGGSLCWNLAQVLQNLVFGLVHFLGLLGRGIVKSQLVQQAVCHVESQFRLAGMAALGGLDPSKHSLPRMVAVQSDNCAPVVTVASYAVSTSVWRFSRIACLRMPYGDVKW